MDLRKYKVVDLYSGLLALHNAELWVDHFLFYGEPPEETGIRMIDTGVFAFYAIKINAGIDPEINQIEAKAAFKMVWDNMELAKKTDEATPSGWASAVSFKFVQLALERRDALISISAFPFSEPEEILAKLKWSMPLTKMRSDSLLPIDSEEAIFELVRATQTPASILERANDCDAIVRRQTIDLRFDADYRLALSRLSQHFNLPSGDDDRIDGSYPLIAEYISRIESSAQTFGQRNFMVRAKGLIDRVWTGKKDDE